jgi:V8-like Glu-specific endopeptidase
VDNHRSKEGRTLKNIGLFIILLSFLFSTITYASGPFDLRPHDINSRLMRSTFKIEGVNSVGTVFIIAEPSKKKPDISYYVLVTAAHVLENMKGDNATLYMRKLDGDIFKKYPLQIKIRDNGKPLWNKHQKADVAAMRVALPQDIDIHMVTTNLLAGDELFVLGYPYGAEANEAGFPILRSGKIASYPLTPIKNTLTFLLDFNVFKGNSGGPVYIYSENRFYGNALNAGVVKFIVGIVSQEWTTKEKVESLSEVTIREHKLGLAVIVHAQFVKDIIEMLPPVED